MKVKDYTIRDWMEIVGCVMDQLNLEEVIVNADQIRSIVAAKKAVAVYTSSKGIHFKLISHEEAMQIAENPGVEFYGSRPKKSLH